MERRMAVSMLYEKHDIVGDGRAEPYYEAWYDAGGVAPVLCKVAKVRRGKGQHPQAKYIPWEATVYITPPAMFLGGTEGPRQLDWLPKTDVSANDAKDDWTADDFLNACRADAELLAERAQMLLKSLREKPKAK